MREPLRLPQTVGYEIEDAKHELRQVIRKHRHRRNHTELEALGEAFAENALQAIGDARSVALYVSTGWEPPTLPLLERLRARDVGVLLPVLGPKLSRTWAFYKSREDLQPRAPGRPPEPSGPVLDAEAVRSVEVVIAPGLAIDGYGNRLGQGGGWYDRVLKLVDPDTPTFAMVFDDELISSQCLPVDEFDVRVHAVITPTRVFLLAGSRLEHETMESIQNA
ncbi:MAG: 5-formyltetrahydrofolate cyclo-ligase [Actinomycetota bacterium]